MIAIILAGGYAKRLWPLSLNMPKVLLPIAGKPIIDYAIEKVLEIIPPPSKIIVSTNQRFQLQFEEWLKNKEYDNIELIPDALIKESEKMGAIKALSDIVSVISQDFIILAGDNLFTDELNSMMRFFNKVYSPVVALYHARNLVEAKRGATVVLDANRRIVEFIEKPQNPKTSLIGACLYAFPFKTIPRFQEYIGLGLSNDEPGKFIEWLYKVEPVYGYMLHDYLWDIGTHESYQFARKFFRQHPQVEYGKPLCDCRDGDITCLK